MHIMDIADGFSLVGNGCCRFNGNTAALTPPGTLEIRVADEQACLQVSCQYCNMDIDMLKAMCAVLILCYDHPELYTSHNVYEDSYKLMDHGSGLVLK
jgi:hypothetical protein